MNMYDPHNDRGTGMGASTSTPRGASPEGAGPTRAHGRGRSPSCLAAVALAVGTGVVAAIADRLEYRRVPMEDLRPHYWALVAVNAVLYGALAVILAGFIPAGQVPRAIYAAAAGVLMAAAALLLMWAQGPVGDVAWGAGRAVGFLLAGAYLVISGVQRD